MTIHAAASSTLHRRYFSAGWHPAPQRHEEIVWQIERLLAEAAVRPVLFYPVGATCGQPWVKGLTIMTNSIYNEWRTEDVWLDQ